VTLCVTLVSSPNRQCGWNAERRVKSVPENKRAGMSGQQLTRELIEEWAYSDIIIDAYEKWR